MYKQPKHTKITLAVFGALALMSGSVAIASPLTVTNSFVSGQLAIAADVNTNFSDAAAAVTDNDVRITTNAGVITTNANGISSNVIAIGTKADTSTVTTNANNISNNVTAIGTKADATAVTTNATDILSIQSRLDALEAAATGGGAPTLPTLASIAGNWGVVTNTAFVSTATNTAETEVDAAFGQFVFNAAGTFTGTLTDGKNMLLSISTLGSTLPDGTAIFETQGTKTETVASGTLSGTVALVNNAITLTEAASGAIFNGFVSQNGQVIIIEGHNEPDVINFFTLVKIQ